MCMVLVRIHVVIGMIRWTGLAPWDVEFPFPGRLASTFLGWEYLFVDAIEFGLVLQALHVLPLQEVVARVQVLEDDEVRYTQPSRFLVDESPRPIMARQVDRPKWTTLTVPVVS